MHKLVADAEHIIEGNRGRYAMESELVEAPPSNESNRIIESSNQENALARDRLIIRRMVDSFDSIYLKTRREETTLCTFSPLRNFHLLMFPQVIFPLLIPHMTDKSTSVTKDVQRPPSIPIAVAAVALRAASLFPSHI